MNVDLMMRHSRKVDSTSIFFLSSLKCFSAVQRHFLFDVGRHLSSGKRKWKFDGNFSSSKFAYSAEQGGGKFTLLVFF